MTSTYWEHNGALQHTADRLRTFIPSTGPVERSRSTNVMLDRYRRACNCYYDLYNNGLCNRAAEFRRIFGIKPSYYKLRPGLYSKELYERVESVMNQIIIAAAKEQQIDYTLPVEY